MSPLAADLQSNRYGKGSLSQSGMWSLTLCSNLAKKSDLSLPARLSKGFPSNAWLNSLTNSKTPWSGPRGSVPIVAF